MGCNAGHLQQQPAMAEPANVRRPVGPLTITNWNLDNLQILLGSAKKQIEVAKGIEVAKISPTSGNAFVVGALQHLRATERVFDRLTQQAAEQKRKKFVPKKIQETHGVRILRIDQPRTIDELTFT